MEPTVNQNTEDRNTNRDVCQAFLTSLGQGSLHQFLLQPKQILYDKTIKLLYSQLNWAVWLPQYFSVCVGHQNKHANKRSKKNIVLFKVMLAWQLRADFDIWMN